MTCVELCSGYEMPLIGLGTWQSKAGDVKTAVKAAINCGYRLLDCAYIYGNEAEVGEALAEVFSEGTVQREEIFVVSKLWNTCHHPDDVRPSLQESLDRLKLKYIDLYLIHWPTAYKRGSDLFPQDDKGETIYEDIYYMDTWRELEKCVDDGLIRSIGLSNFNSQQLQDVLDNCRIKPAALEIEVHPFLQQHKLVEFCQQRHVAVIAYSSFGSPERPLVCRAAGSDKPVLEDETLKSIGARHGVSVAQVIVRWLYQRGVVAIPKSVTPARIQQNREIFGFALTDDEMAEIKSLDRNVRLIAPVVERNGVKELRDKAAPYFPFHIEF